MIFLLGVKTRKAIAGTHACKKISSLYVPSFEVVTLDCRDYTGRRRNKKLGCRQNNLLSQRPCIWVACKWLLMLLVRLVAYSITIQPAFSVADTYLYLVLLYYKGGIYFPFWFVLNKGNLKDVSAMLSQHQFAQMFVLFPRLGNHILSLIIS